MFEQLKPGSEITLSVKRTPTRPDDVETLRRLMRMSRSSQRALARAKSVRDRTTATHPRGGRTWKVRQTVGKLVHPEAGEAWTLMYRPQIAADLASVAEYVEVRQG